MKILKVLDLAAYQHPSGCPQRSKAIRKKVLETHFEALTLSNCAYLASNPDAPLIYESGVVYRRDPINGMKSCRIVSELWSDIPAILAAGWQDCESLSAWLAAELRVRAPNSVGTERRPQAGVMLKATRYKNLWHAIVIDRATGERFDPSRRLGMGREEV